MAPTSPIKRVTRARAAAKTGGDEPTATKVGATKVSKPTASKSTATASTTRKTRAIRDDIDHESVEAPAEVSKLTKTTRTTKPAPLIAAPRRRIKVTPLDAPSTEDSAPAPQIQKTTKKPSTRTKKADAGVSAEENTADVPLKTRARTTKGTTTAKKAASQETAEAAAPKTRGRPKKDTITADVATAATEVARSTRSTRTRSASVASQQPSDTIEVAAKPKTAARKKVTFQDLPEDEKENEVIPSRTAAGKKATTATGMRAKPVRKPVTSGVKKATTTKSRAAKPATRVLTPKKVTQVARASTPEGSEDELNGAKTPVRDLSLSPKRNLNVAAMLSPAKKLDFNQGLFVKSPQKATSGDILLSPARRPSSPAKSNTAELTTAVDSTAGVANLLQSPKRGIPDASIFPASAIKAKKSPFKESLLQSPARRLFSPAKSKTPLSIHRDVERGRPMEVVEEISISSHFRGSVSPQRQPRVYRMTDAELADELAMEADFDQSVLKLTSPKKSPLKSSKIVSAVLDEEPPMQIIQNDVEETAKAVEELQTMDTDMNVDEEDVEEVDEIVEPAHMSISATDKSAAEDDVDEQQPTAMSKAPRLSQILFRTSRFREDEESSEDELAADQTPDRAPGLFRSSLTGASNPRTRLSGVQHSVAGVGFTPLAAQMSGWLANSPNKTPAKSANKQTATGSLFSPLASQHVAGEIQISRNNTPQQARSSPAFKTSVSSRPSLNMAQADSPERSTFFAEQMSAMDDGDVASSSMDNINIFADQDEDMTTQSEVVAENDFLRASLQMHDDTPMSVAEEEDDTVIVNKAPTDLTTDLVNTVHASDTAMLDFEQLAHEAEGMAHDDEDNVESSFESVYGDENAPPDQTLNFSVLEHSSTTEQPTVRLESVPRMVTAENDQTLNFHILEQDEKANEQQEPMLAQSPVLSDERTLNLHVLEQSASAQTPVSSRVAESGTPLVDTTLHFDLLEQNPGATPGSKTPVSRYDLSDEQTLTFTIMEEQSLEQGPIEPQQHFEASISPEGSPAPTASPTKVIHEETGMVTPRAVFSGPRIVNTVVSKVPLKPAAGMTPIQLPKKRSRSMSMSRQQSPPKRPLLTPTGKVAARSISDSSLSAESMADVPAATPAQSTPGQMSFAVDDFGDSTLDAIEIPEDDMDVDFSIPPMEVSQSTQGSKTAKSTPARAPLKTVNDGPLQGAVVYVEVHTGEGADASEVYTTLLTELGARTVREWRWNPRASVHGGDDLSSAGKPGITHVVYKDGGKRTLEKVRDAKGEVLCVGCAWVLECERNKEWVDETPYLVNSEIFPRGGSRRRKSMEPRALVNANGNLSTARANAGRRSVSAEFMTSQMREELINTPVRNYQPPAANARQSLGGDSLFGDSDISSTYNSPTTTMNVHHVATPTELVGWDPATSKTPAKVAGSDDMGMDTPYLMKQGGMILDHMAGRDGGVMSAPPKQIGKGLFDDASSEGSEKENGDNLGGASKDPAVKMKLKLQEARRRTLGFKPTIGSPLGKF